MRKAFIVIALAVLGGCDSNKTESKTDSMKSPDNDSTKQQQEVALAYPVNYSSKFEMGDPRHSKIILDLWKDWDNGNLSNHKDSFADSVEMHFADGSIMHSTRDSVIATAQNFRNQFASAVSSVDAVMPVKSIDKNENWVLVWGKEIDTDKKGKVDSFYLQETWRINKAGKTDLLYQFRAAGMPPKK
jgi:hypothetical protein